MSTDGLLPWPENTGRIVLDEVDSTMAEAARIAPGLARPTWIMARRQMAARGRRGQAWASPEGNFAATFVYRPGCGPAAAALRSFAAANALYEALAMQIDRDRLAVKWPNDVLLNGGKVAGILLESSGQGGNVDWLAIGFGVNLLHAPEEVADAAFRPVSLAGEGGEPVGQDAFLAYLASGMATEERLLSELGFGPVREKWLRRAARLGETILARTGREEIEGIFETVDEAGQLVLRTRRGTVRVPAAEVYF